MTNPLPVAPPASNEPQAGILLQLMQEMRDQRASYERQQAAAIAERKSEHRWRMILQALVFGLPAVLGVILFVMSMPGVSLGPLRDVIGIVRITGPIASDAMASADHVVPALRKAFASERVKAVVLAIDSPGGAPVESERINAEIAQLKQRHGKPVVAVIGNIGASAGYMIAMKADHVVAARYSMVGSIGAIMTPWNLADLTESKGVRQRVFASGPMKNFLNPFTKPDVSIDKKAQAIVDTAAQLFMQELTQDRGDRLKQGVDVATGEVWTGPEALTLGLVDSVGTLESYVAGRWGDIPLHDFSPKRDAFGNVQAAVADVFVTAVRTLAQPSLR